MKKGLRKYLLVAAILIIIAASFIFLTSSERRIDYSADVKPILNKKCIACHGGVKKQGGFSVLFREEALALTKNGKRAIVPGEPGKSEMIRRITETDPEERMPYKHEPLSKQEISILKRWIRQGAEWGEHWAYVSVKETEVPAIKDEWIRNDIDRFILDRLKDEKLKPSPAADKPTLLRRVGLDLIGMLPSQSIADRYLQSNDDKAYEVLIDSLLASPHYGERWASMWLDLARYADTKGYESDYGRDIWQYRDWVIRAFNEDKRYDQFITEQIAGDLLPDPTDAQYIATGFHRNSMTNDEGGTDNEEFRTAAVLDRVNTTWEALMGTTFACVQCHSHPYDPFRHEEYYGFMAYFNNTRDRDVEGEYPVLRTYNDTMQRQLQAVTTWIKNQVSEEKANGMNRFLRTIQPAYYSNFADSLKNAVVINNNSNLAFRNNAVARIKDVDLEGANQLVYRYSTYRKGGEMKMHLDSPTAPPVATWKAGMTKNWTWATLIIDIPPQKGVHDVYFTYHTTDDTSKGINFLAYFDYFAFTHFPGKDAGGFAGTKKMFNQLLMAEVPSTPVMVENSTHLKRKTFVFERGNWTSKGKEVQAGVPQLLNYAMPAGAPNNRMGLALWLTNKKNPLVSRTIVNRLWEQLFGTGIVETLEDMGTQGIAPTHRELLDHLAWKFVNDHNWSIKKMLKEMLMSATYRQDSKLSDELREKDQFNRLYARGSRIRLNAEQVRDQNLCISGMMNAKMYGAGVMPWQPDGIWQSPYNGLRWQSSKGVDQYRRAVYTYWKRSSPYPSMLTFDGAQRVVCNARRIRTNTPLQALVTLNDSVYLDLSRHFAYRMQKEGGKNVQQQVSKGYELMLYKKMPPEKLQVFMKLYDTALKTFSTDAVSTCEMVGINDEHNKPETAALVVVANAMLNLDEVIMKN